MAMTSAMFESEVGDMSPLQAGYEGSLTADALAMPVHWYYDVGALRREYGFVDHFVAPKNPHTGSILWRSTFTPLNERADILRGQAHYWGKKDIHYHQFLKAGENTLNFQLARELYKLVKTNGDYNADQWLEVYRACMLTPNWHNDTYVEEYHRAFFNNYAQGLAPRKCGIDDQHIGGLATVPALVAGLEGKSQEHVLACVREHVALTHHNKGVLNAAAALVKLLFRISSGESVRGAIRLECGDWLSGNKADSWLKRDDTAIVGGTFSSACYIQDAMSSALYLAWKYADDFAAGITANTMVGGDNCHRGAVVGSVLGAAAAV